MVQKKRSECPVYEVCLETGQGRVRILHHNMLLSCEFLLLEKVIPVQRKTAKEQQRAASHGRYCSFEDESEWTGFQAHFKPSQGNKQRRLDTEEFYSQATPESSNEDGQSMEMVEFNLEEVVPQHVEEVRMGCENRAEESSEA